MYLVYSLYLLVLLVNLPAFTVKSKGTTSLYKEHVSHMNPDPLNPFAESDFLAQQMHWTRGGSALPHIVLSSKVRFDPC